MGQDTELPPSNTTPIKDKHVLDKLAELDAVKSAISGASTGAVLGMIAGGPIIGSIIGGVIGAYLHSKADKLLSNTKKPASTVEPGKGGEK